MAAFPPLLVVPLGGLFVLAARAGGIAAASPADQEEDARRGTLQAPAEDEDGGDATRSLLSAPLFLDATPPECRTLEVLHLAFGPEAGRTREEALELALRLRAEASDADRFRALSAEYSAAPAARFGGVVGTFASGVLEPRSEDFLWNAAVGDLSAPIATDDAVLLLRRGERWAGCRILMIDGAHGDALGRARAARARLEAGEDFGDLARELSDDAASAARGGDYHVFERGPQDRLLKRAVFEAAVGELVGPLSTPLGYVVAQRVPPEDLAPELWEQPWVRVRALLVSHADAGGPVELNPRPFRAAAELAADLARRIRDEGADMAALAAEYDDDPGGTGRRGDLGWIRRDGPTTHSVVHRVLNRPVGELVGPLPLPIGYLLLRREEA